MKRKTWTGGRSGLFLGVAVGVLVTIPVHSQSYAGIGNKPQVRPSQQKESVARKDTKVTLAVANRSIEWVVREIGQQAKLRVVYNSGLPDIQKRVTIDLKDVNAFEAIQLVLKGTKLEAAMTMDGGGVMISAKSADTTTTAPRSGGTIQGSVLDSTTRRPVAGVTIQIADHTGVAVTNADGTFTMTNISPGTHLVSAKILGYASATTQVTVTEGQVATVRFELHTAATALAGVVTTATGEQRKVEVAHDIARIDPQKIMQRTPVRTFADLIEAAQVPGVLVQRQSGEPGAPTKIRIRGIGSISQSNDPVIILDGVWIDASVGQPSRLDDIDPATIQSVEIVRGPSAATLYGQDASNGVIIIKTKRGEAGPSRWTVSYNRDWGQTYGKQPLAYLGFGRDPVTGATMQCSIASVLRYLCEQDSVTIFDPNNTLLDREATETNDRVTFGVEGGTNSTLYAITGTLARTIGVRQLAPIDAIRLRLAGYEYPSKFKRPSELNRRNITANFTMIPRDNITLGLSLTGTQTKLGNNLLTYTYITSPNKFLVNELSLDTVNFLNDPVRVSAAESPTESDAVVLGGTARWQPWSSSVVNGTLGYERATKDGSSFSHKTNCNPGVPCADTVGYRSDFTELSTVQTVRLNGSTDLNLGALSRFLELRPSIGGDFRKTVRNQLRIESYNIPTGERTFPVGNVNPTVLRKAEATAGWYASTMVGLVRRIYFDLGVRQDIGSAITSSKNAMYPKIGTSWLISDEGFWRRNDIVNTLRLRTAFGHSAVQPEVADLLGKYLAAYEFVDEKYVRSVDMRGIGNTRVRPERATEFEIGFDADWLFNRVSTVVTYAHAENVNTLVVRALPSSAGGVWENTRKENIARIRNRNFEMSTEARVIENQTILMVLNYGMTLSDNVVRKLGNGTLPFSDVVVSRVQEGYPLAGVWTREALGYRDADGNGLLSLNEVVLSDSAVYVGWSQPKYRASYGASITFRGLLTFDSRFAYQSKYVQQYTRENRYGAEDIHAPLDQQAIEIVSGIQGRRPVTDLRWNSASVTYHVPRSILRQLHARSLNISLQASNLALWTNYVGRDPGVNSSIDTEMLTDVGNVIPRPRLFVLDFKFGW